jgi:arginyl-tRNA synthetase
MINGLFVDASRVLHRFLRRGGYGLIYGSHARGTAGTRSDLDLLLIADARLDQAETEALIRDVKILHGRYGLDLDEEVSYEVKLVAGYQEVARAIALDGFVIDPAGRRSVPRVVAEPGFLNSGPFKLRLILNALTSPHIFLGGDVKRYREHQAQASRAVALLALSLAGEAESMSVTHLVRVLISDPGSGSRGEDYLGYVPTDVPTLHSRVQCGLTDLNEVETAHAVDGPSDPSAQVWGSSVTSESAPRP